MSLTDLVVSVARWPFFLLLLAIFGIAPGLFLRLLGHAWPRSHPRRAELRAELHAVPYLLRPFWVAEQLETAIFDGFGARLRERRLQRFAVREFVGQRLSPLSSSKWWVPFSHDLSRLEGTIEATLLERAEIASELSRSLPEVDAAEIAELSPEDLITLVDQLLVAAPPDRFRVARDNPWRPYTSVHHERVTHEYLEDLVEFRYALVALPTDEPLT